MGQSRRRHFLGLSTALILSTITILVRSYHLPQNFMFAEDQEDLAWRVKQIIIDHQPTLISAKFSQVGVYLPPGYLYLLTPFFLSFDFHPSAGMAAVVALAGVTGLLMYLTGGPITWLLYTFSPLLNTWDRIFWNPNLILPAATLVVLALKTKKPLLAALGSALALQSHPQAIFLQLITLIYFRRHWPLIAAILFLSLSPLLLFDLRHDWVITTGLFSNHNFSWRPYYLLFIYPFILTMAAWLFNRHQIFATAVLVLFLSKNIPAIFNQSPRPDSLSQKIHQAKIALEQISANAQPRIHFLTSSEGYNYIFWYLTRDTNLPSITYYEAWQNAPQPKAIISP